VVDAKNMDDLDDYDLQVKLLMIGDSGVGKTCLLLRYANDAFSKTFITTIGIDFKNKLLEHRGKKVRLQIWDTAGQERFRTITTSYFRGAQGILLVYDIADQNSFKAVHTWIDQVDKHASEGVSKILVGNKCDVDVAERQVTAEQGQAVAEKYGMSFFETSAKENIKVIDAFEAVARETTDKVLSRGVSDIKSAEKKHVAFNPDGGRKKKCC
jgi:Ras-related protein Rab-8A